jgi:hypothetical protein
MYKVYRITPYYNCYRGESLVAGIDAEDAQSYIREFRRIDENNAQDSYGYDDVAETDCIEHLFSDIQGIIHYGIYYSG